MEKARLIRYGRFQLQDFVIERVIFVVVLSALEIAAPMMAARSLPPAQRIVAAGSPLGAQVAVLFTTLILMAVLFCSQEIISRQRKGGFYRFIFAKAVNPVAFYGQLFLVHLVATVLLVCLLASIFSIVAAPVAVGHIAFLTAIAFILFGGIGFLASAFMRFDSIVVIGAFGVSALGKMAAAQYGGFAPKLANLLIPTDHLFALRPLIFGDPVHASDVAWVAGYGAAAIALALAGVRYRQLAD